MKKPTRLLIVASFIFLSIKLFSQDTTWENFTDGHTVIDIAQDPILCGLPRQGVSLNLIFKLI
jgi:hypothetical protein